MPDASAFGDSQGVLALLGTLGLGVWSAINLRKGQKDTHELDADKAELERERFEHERQASVAQEQDHLIGTLRDEVTRLTAARIADQLRCDQEIERLGIRHAAQRAQCVQVTRRLHEDLLASAGALRSEVDATAARDAAQLGETHLRLEHDDLTD